MTLLLIKFDDNYADEFDLVGYYLTTKERWDAHVDDVTKYWKMAEDSKKRPQQEGESDWRYRDSQRVEVEVGFGTNESMLWTSAEDYLRAYTVTEITEEEAAVVRKLFLNGRESGTFGDWVSINDPNYIGRDWDEGAWDEEE